MNSQAFNSILTTLDRSSVFSKILDGNPVAGATQRASVGDRTAKKESVTPVLKSKNGYLSN
jgi:hypothetical protein